MNNDEMTVVVEQERRRRGGLLWIAGATAASLLVGGSTFALWSASSTFDGGSVTTGTIDLNTGAPSWYDVSPDRKDQNETIPGTTVTKAHSVDPGIWRMVPGDEVAMAVPAQINLVGDNLVASFSALDLPDGNEGFPINKLEYSYALYQNGAELIPRSPLPADGLITHFESPDLGQGGDSDAVPGSVITVDGVGEVTVVLFAHFVDASGIEDVNAVAAIGDGTLVLEQVRHEGAQFA